MFRLRISRVLTLFAFLALVVGPVHWFDRVQSANLVDVTFTLSNPRLSYYAILNASNTVGTNIVNINTTAGAAPSTSSANLFEGESVLIGTGTYTVASVSANASFTVETPLLAGDADTADVVIATRRPQISVGFTPVTSMQQNWDFRVLIPAGTTDPDDGVPDAYGWDYGSTTATNITVTCPTGNTYTVTRNINVNIGGINYHSFRCNLDDAAVVAPGTPRTIVVGSATATESLINPAPNSTHINGYADTYPIVIQQLDAADNVVDQTVSSVAVVDAVRVTASVPPQISFRILGVASGASRCGGTTTSASTSTLVPLGELLIDAFKMAAQELVVSTNASDGYALTTVAENQLHRVGESCVGDADLTDGGCIQDTVGDGTTAMTHNIYDKWVTTAAKGFGYSLEENSVSTTADAVFEHDTTGGSAECDGTSGGCWRQFADAEAAETPVSILSSTSVADSDSLYICYRAVVSPSQQAGTDYSTYVTYRATATF